jgi:protein involved in polysaccharide export with SLBB domain
MSNIFKPSKTHCLLVISVFIFCFSVFLSSIHAESNTNSDEIIIDNGDLLYVIIPKEVTSEFNPTEKNYFKAKVEVDRHGYIFLPSQGNIKVSDHTTQQISEILTNNLPKYLSKSDKATVNLIEKRHYVQILGSVVTPGWYNIPESANIQTILSQAGGAMEGADLASATINRKEKGKTIRIPADIQEYLVKGDIGILPILHENDTVFIPLSISPDGSNADTDDNAKIRIFGAVNTPGMYPDTKNKGKDLLNLIIAAGGPIPNADLTNIKIIRVDGKREMYNMQSQLDTQESAAPTSFPVIHGGDIVHITKRQFGATDAAGNAIQAAQTVILTGPGSTKQGPHAFNPPTTPFKSISEAGGLTQFADTSNISIIRRKEGQQQNLPYNYDKALLGEEPDVNLQLMADDIIYIPLAKQQTNATDAAGNAVKAAHTITFTGPGSHKQGPYPFVSPSTPLEAISQAGGVLENADSENIIILRREDNVQHLIPYNFDKALKSEEPDVNFQLETDDIVYIPLKKRQTNATDAAGNAVFATDIVTFTGLGSHKQGPHPFTPPTTAFEAIAQAGGLNEFANADDIMIIRKTDDGEREIIPYDYDKALNGEEPDVSFQLKSDDIIYIPW